ncbi:MAG: DUF167 domain-containing protein [Hyphomicrobiales bacterium]
MAFARIQEDRIYIAVRVTPNASKNEISGIYEGADGTRALKIRVTTAPEKGKANKGAIAVLARAIGCAKNDLEIVSGETARMKTVALDVPLSMLEEIIRKLS